jgi:hypothetical protein
MRLLRAQRGRPTAQVRSRSLGNDISAGCLINLSNPEVTGDRRQTIGERGSRMAMQKPYLVADQAIVGVVTAIRLENR